jgi:NADPH:quinone reductase-like Zn-dependent oxidoreductase
VDADRERPPAAAGYVVVATSSPKNVPLLRELGASQVFDRSNTLVIQDIAAAVLNNQSLNEQSVKKQSLNRSV